MCSIGLDASMHNARRIREGAIDLKIRAPVADGRFDDWREAFGRVFLRLDILPKGEMFNTDVSLRAMPGLGLGSITTSACSLSRTPELLADGQDDIGLIALLGGRGRAMDCQGREVELRPGEAVFLRNGHQGIVEYTDDTRHVCFTIPERALSPFVTDLDAACMQAINVGTGPLALLLRYAQIIVADETVLPHTGAAIARHVHDLAAIVMTRSPELAAALSCRGARSAARLAAIKAEIGLQLGNSALSVVSIAARLGITPRYIAKLFEQDGTSFSTFVMEQRLGLAYSLLEDPWRTGISISTLALTAGFGDISHFNKCFRRRYGMTPSDVRNRARAAENPTYDC
jgi:AraC-like DNA-binding protein